MCMKDFYSDYVHCGDDSKQCVKIADMCNYVADCRNGWDEDPIHCEQSSAVQSRFVTTGARLIYFMLRFHLHIHVHVRLHDCAQVFC